MPRWPLNVLVALVCAAPLAAPVFADGGDIPPATEQASPDLAAEVARLKQRIAELEAENARLKQQAAAPATAPAPKTDAKVSEENARLAEENAQLKRQLDLTATQRQDLVVENKRLEELAGLTAKGEKVESAAALIKSRYVPEEGKTVVTSVPERLTMEAGIFDVPHVTWFEYAFSGEEMTAKPETVSFYLVAAGNTRQKYKHADSVRLTIDGESITLPVADYAVTTETKGASRVGQKRFNESLRVDLSSDTLRKLARSRQATAELPSATIAFPAEVLATAKAMRERIELGL